MKRVYFDDYGRVAVITEQHIADGVQVNKPVYSLEVHRSGFNAGVTPCGFENYDSYRFHSMVFYSLYESIAEAEEKLMDIDESFELDCVLDSDSDFGLSA